MVNAVVNKQFSHYLTEMDRSNPALEKACEVMDGIADKIFLVKTIKNGARAIYKQVREGNLLPGRRNMEIFSACLYLSCWYNAPFNLYFQVSFHLKMSCTGSRKCPEPIMKSAWRAKSKRRNILAVLRSSSRNWICSWIPSRQLITFHDSAPISVC